MSAVQISLGMQSQWPARGNWRIQVPLEWRRALSRSSSSTTARPTRNDWHGSTTFTTAQTVVRADLGRWAGREPQKSARSHFTTASTAASWRAPIKTTIARLKRGHLRMKREASTRSIWAASAEEIEAGVEVAHSAEEARDGLQPSSMGQSAKHQQIQKRLKRAS